jgi:hypothetical protein
MKSLLKTATLMGILLSGILFSSQTAMAGSVMFNISNVTGDTCSYQSFYGGEEGTIKVNGSNESFTIKGSSNNWFLIHLII